MNKMLDLIRRNAVPPALMKKAVLGQLTVPLPEQLEVLVYLTTHERYATEAQQTLAAWDDDSVLAACAEHTTTSAVLRYFLIADLQRRATMLPHLLGHPSITDDILITVARTANHEELEALLGSRAHSRPAVLRAILANPWVTAEQKADCKKLLDSVDEVATPDANDRDVLGLMEAIANFEREHAAEILAEEGKRFELIRGHPDEVDEIAEMMEIIEVPAFVEKKAAKLDKPEERERLSVLQKIARLTVGERVQLAMKGNKDERFVLIRDGSRVVCLAVLESPKVTDSEAESFAAMKNVQELVLRRIAAKRKFMKKYAVVRALAQNPKTPLDLGLSLLPHLLTVDLRYLSANKNVGETLRKVAAKFWRDRQEKK